MCSYKSNHRNLILKQIIRQIKSNQFLETGCSKQWDSISAEKEKEQEITECSRHKSILQTQNNNRNKTA